MKLDIVKRSLIRVHRSALVVWSSVLFMTGCGVQTKEPVQKPLSVETVWTGQEENIDKAVLENQAAVIRVKNGSGYGSGVLFAVEGNRVIAVTNSHVLQQTDSGSVEFADGEEAPFVLLVREEKKDIALLAVDGENLTEQTRQSIRLASPSMACYRRLERGAEAGVSGVGEEAYSTCVGSVLDKSWYLDDFGMEMLYLDCRAKPGMSGGAVVDAHGHYMGMLTGGNGEEAAAVPWPVIEEIYMAFLDR